MKHLRSYREGLTLFTALGSDTRIRILELLIEKGPLFMTAIAGELKLTGGALTAQVKMLQDMGLISIEQRSGHHGTQKLCSINNEGIVIEPPLGDS